MTRHLVAAPSLARLVAAGLGSGYAPVAAGTVASAAAVAVGALFLWTAGPALLLVAALLATVGGWWAVEHGNVDGDPGWVVIDEYAGQWIAMLAVGRIGVVPLLAAFVLFRFFDVTKLGPVGWADRQHGAFGIMADDVIAGVIAAGCLWVLRLALPAWFG